MRYVIRDGKLVVKGSIDPCPYWRSRADFPAPNVSRFEAMESPVTGKEITSWRERDRDMEAANCCDPRDLPQKPFEKRRADNARDNQA
jgi:hypothetical protein